VPKVVHIIASLHSGGAETMLCRLLRGMDRKKFDPVVIALMRGGALEEAITALDIPLYHAGMRQGMPSLGAFARIVKILRKEKADFVQGWMVHGNLAAQFASRFVSPSPRVFWAVHNSLESLQREKRLTALLIRLSARLSNCRAAGRWSGLKPEKIVYVSQVSREQHQRVGFDGSLSVMIPNGIDTDLFARSEAHRSSVRQELGLGPETVLIGLMGRFHPQKNHAGFFCAAKKVVDRYPGTKILFAGSGMERGNEVLASLLRECGSDALRDSIYLLGERRDMPRLNAALDIAVSASSYGEALSLAVAEAMASAVPCVVTNVGDNGFLVGKAGIVVEPNDPEAFADGCCALIGLGAAGRQALGAVARQRIVNHYALPAVVRRYEDLYSSQPLHSYLQRS
jgi:glycosyltransferase involved in cell wall biosynthesis